MRRKRYERLAENNLKKEKKELFVVILLLFVTVHELFARNRDFLANLGITSDATSDPFRKLSEVLGSDDIH